jgi:hypothetical protein
MGQRNGQRHAQYHGPTNKHVSTHGGSPLSRG